MRVFTTVASVVKGLTRHSTRIRNLHDGPNDKGLPLCSETFDSLMLKLDASKQKISAQNQEISALIPKISTQTAKIREKLSGTKDFIGLPCTKIAEGDDAKAKYQHVLTRHAEVLDQNKKILDHNEWVLLDNKDFKQRLEILEGKMRASKNETTLVTLRHKVELFHEMLVAECVPHFIMSTSEDSPSTLIEKLEFFTTNNFEVLSQKLQEQKNNQVLRDVLAKKGICLDELASVGGVLLKGLKLANRQTILFGPSGLELSLDASQSEVEKILDEDFKNGYDLMLKFLDLMEYYF